MIDVIPSRNSPSESGSGHAGHSDDLMQLCDRKGKRYDNLVVAMGRMEKKITLILSGAGATERGRWVVVVTFSTVGKQPDSFTFIRHSRMQNSIVNQMTKMGGNKKTNSKQQTNARNLA